MHFKGHQCFMDCLTIVIHIRKWRFMMTSSNGNIFRVTGPLCGEFTGPGEFPTQRPVTWRFDVFFDLHLNKRLSKQPWGWWFDTLSWSLWRHCNVIAWIVMVMSWRLFVMQNKACYPLKLKPCSYIQKYQTQLYICRSTATLCQGFFVLCVYMHINPD